MSALAPTLQAFFTERLIAQRAASPQTIAAYRDAIRLLLRFARDLTGHSPSELEVSDLDAGLIGAFLDHLERERGNSISTRNARLAAIRSLLRFAELRHPEHAETIARALAISPKLSEDPLVSFLDVDEVEALLAAPDQATRAGRRDRVLLMVAAQTGLRVSELTGLRVGDAHLGAGAHVSCRGKGRKERSTPLSRATVAALRVWIEERGGSAEDPLFPAREGGRLSRDALERRLARHVQAATVNCPSLAAKTVTMHVLRHTTAMRLLHAGVDTSVIALWLGHESVQTTQVYLRADLALKERALDRTRPPEVEQGRYRPPDALLAFLEAL